MRIELDSVIKKMGSGVSRITIRGLMFLSLMNLLWPSVAPSQDEESLGRQAEQAGRPREALTHYLAALQTAAEGSDADQRLRERIIAVALKMKPAPILPTDAVRIEGRAEAAVRSAQSATDFLDAAKEYRVASRIAPWHAPYYFNLGVVLERGGQPADAIRNYKLYLLAAPTAPDAVTVQKKIGELEYDIDKLAKAQRQAEAEQAARNAAAAAEERHHAEQIARLPTLLPGIWEYDYSQYPRGQSPIRYQITRTGDTFTMRVLARRIPFDGDEWGPGHHWGLFFCEASQRWEWSLNGRSIQGTWVNDETTCEGRAVSGGRAFTRSLRGTVDPDALTIHLEHNDAGCSVNVKTFKFNTTDCGESEAKELLRKVE